MAEILTLTTPETFPSNATWRVLDVSINVDAPSIKVTLRSDSGRDDVWRYVVSDTVTSTQVRNAIIFINNGNFKTLGKTLQKWLLEQIAILDNKAGTVTGTPD